MKKYLLALALLLGLCFPARANVPCTVPFQLTNGTLADASQVMANYNAILTCLATQAAASGGNSDITALLALTTPITPAQGGAAAICGVSGFTAVNTPGHTASEINFTYTQAILTTTLGQVQFGQAGALTLNLGSVGANGLDVGALGASSFYYLYLIGQGPGTGIAALGSLSSTAPSLPAGYTYFCRVGVWETGTGSALLSLKTGGRKTQLLQGSTTNISAGALQTSATIGTSCLTSSPGLAATTFAGIPPTAVRAFGSISSNASGSATSATWVGSYAGAAGLNDSIVGTDELAFGIIGFNFALASAQTLFVCNSSGSNGVIIGGWEDAVAAN